MSVEIDIRNALIANVPLSEMVGGKIYAGTVDQGTEPPYIRFFNVSSTPFNSLSDPASLERARIQFDCYAKGYGDSKRLYDLLKNAILNSGLPATLQNKFDRFEEEADLNTVTCDYYFWE